MHRVKLPPAHRSKRTLLAFRFLAFLVLAVQAVAQEFDQGPVFTVIEENDLIVDTDRHYTQGIKLSYLGADNQLPALAKRFSDALPAFGYDKRADKLGLEIGQNIYTPANLEATRLLPNDRPYAGWLYTGLILQRRGPVGERFLALESLQLDLGVIGPESLAEQAQTWIHEIRGFDVPRGWSNQLKTEPGLAFKYQRSWLISLPERERHYVDLIPHAGTSLGNVETSFRAGATLRLGFNLPEDFGVQTISSLITTEGGWSPSRQAGRWGFYVFTGVEGWAVLYTAFLDGNLYQSSPHVEREPLEGEWKMGAALVLKRVELGFTYVYRSREFIGQEKDNGYGSAFLKVKF